MGTVLLHRDIKLSNIMLDSNFNAKLGNFGLANLVDHRKGSQTRILPRTMGYMAPECLMKGTALKRYQNWWSANIEVHLAIPPQDLLVGLGLLSQAQPKGTGLITPFTAPATTTPTPATTENASSASPPPSRVIKAGSKKAAKVVENEQSKELIVFQRSEKRRQQLVLKNEVAAAEALQKETARRQQTTEHYALRSSPIINTTTSETVLAAPSPPEEVPVITSSSVIVDTPGEDTSSPPILCPPSPSSFSPSSLNLLVARTIDIAKDTSTSSPIHMQPSLASTRDLFAHPMSMEKMGIF
ncbi:uncharacterized protein LOC114276761 [Camellia sinensis]|uniref:uncharacterized protein LOC114276761 n=1 Tax=Camellia sinensis TaxID=4442 RepID=UPI0010369418|nr:uncharacterized protein LOC114276761 [Camellia sinensis]